MNLTGEVHAIANGTGWIGSIELDGSFAAALRRFGSGWDGTGVRGAEIVLCERDTKDEAVAWVRGRLTELGCPTAKIQGE